MKPKIAIDIGSFYTKIYKARAGVVLCEPTCIAIKNKNYKTPFAFGEDAYSLIGKTPEGVEIIFPVCGTEIVDNKAIILLISHFIKKIKKPFEIIQDVLLPVACGSNREIIKKFENVLIGAKLYNVCYAESSHLSLLGANVDLSYETPNAIVDFGANQTTVCVLTKLGVISGASAEFGGNDLNKMIIKHVEEDMNLLISSSTAETLKTQLSSLDEDDETKIVISGKDTLSGKQKVTQISANRIYKPLKEFTDKVIKIINAIFSSLESETLSALSSSGVWIVGGGSNVYGICEYLSKQLDVQVTKASQAEIASIIGAGKLVENNDLFERLKLKV